MSSLNRADTQLLEKLLGMSGGYVLDFSDRTLAELVSDSVELDIHDERYSPPLKSQGTTLKGESDLSQATLAQRGLNIPAVVRKS